MSLKLRMYQLICLWRSFVRFQGLLKFVIRNSDDFYRATQMHCADYAVTTRKMSVCPSVTRRYSYGALDARAVWRNLDFRPVSHFISEMMQVRAIVTMEREYEIIPKLSNGVISNDLEQPLPLVSRSCHYLSLDISETAKWSGSGVARNYG